MPIVVFLIIKDLPEIIKHTVLKHISISVIG